MTWISGGILRCVLWLKFFRKSTNGRAVTYRHKGAYAQFKALLESANVLERWYKFENDSVRSALTAWCSENEIKLRTDGDEPVA